MKGQLSRKDIFLSIQSQAKNYPAGVAAKLLKEVIKEEVKPSLLLSADIKGNVRAAMKNLLLCYFMSEELEGGCNDMSNQHFELLKATIVKGMQLKYEDQILMEINRLSFAHLPLTNHNVGEYSLLDFIRYKIKELNPRYTIVFSDLISVSLMQNGKELGDKVLLAPSLVAIQADASIKRSFWKSLQSVNQEIKDN